MKFSERIGKRVVKSDIQLDSMDDNLKNGLWNVLVYYIVDPMNADNSAYQNFKKLVLSIWFSFYKEPIDSIKYNGYDFKNDLRYRFTNWNYLDVYDFIDFIVSQSEETLPFSKEKFIDTSNFILERELSGYRFIKNQLAPITNENEIIEIEKALHN